jgi:hypothetical protein
MKTKISLFILAIFIALFTIQCSKSDDDSGQTNGNLSLKITDAPSDDANIQAIFVTVAGAKVNGVSVEGFQKQTIKISDLHSGETQLLFAGDVEADTYSNISLVLDYDKDVSGNAPGCYVMDKTNVKHNLYASSSASSEIKLDKSFVVSSDGTTNLVIDFDLRKSVIYNENSTASNKFKFVTDAELKNSLRVVLQEKSGEIKGKASNNFSNSELVVYAYRKNQFNAATETQAQGSSNVLFAKAVSSAKVNADGTYKLTFLDEGDYEVHVVSYGHYSSTGKLTFKGLVTANSIISGLVMNNISVSGNASVDLNFNITVLP